MHPRRDWTCLAALLTFVGVPEARADGLTVARDQPLREVSHSVDVSIEAGVARYTVRRSFANDGAQAEEASLRIRLAHGAAATGLRIKARDRWFTGELMDADEARSKYRELTGIGAWEAKDPALLQWVWADQVHLQVFPVLPGGVNTVEYTLTAPLEYRGGRYVLTYPHADRDRPGSLPTVDPVLRVHPGRLGAEVRVAGLRVAADAPVVLVPPPPTPWVGDGEADEGASYVFSKLDVDRDEPVTHATVQLEIDHTFSGDLQVALVTPGGEHLHVTAGRGGENDLRGSFDVDLPAGSGSLGAWHLVVSDRAGLDVGSLDAWSLELTPGRKGAAKFAASADDLPRFIPDAPDGSGAAGHVLIEVGAPKIRGLVARLGRVMASAVKGFSRLEIDAAPRLGELPRRASVVFVLDTSRSLDDEGLNEQLRIAEAYLSHVPDSSVELVATSRAATRVFGEFVGAAEFAAAVARARTAGALALKNGSALDEGLGLASRLLAERSGPARVVALTDARLRSRFRVALADQALAAAPQGAVTHVVIPEPDSVAGLRRDDAHDLAKIADRHLGALYFASAPQDDKSNARELLALVRPVAIDSFEVRGIDLSSAGELPAALREGTGYRAMFASADPSRRVVVSGKLWATPVRRVVTHEASFDVATAAFVFSEDEHQELTDDEMRQVAYRGRVVSPVTSYLATEPGVRPSVAGLEPDEVMLSGMGLSGFGSGGGGGSSGPLPRLQDLLAGDAQACAQTHAAPAGWTVALAIETTGREIVDVEVTAGSHAGVRDCIVEAAWSLELLDGAWPQRERHAVSFL